MHFSNQCIEALYVLLQLVKLMEQCWETEPDARPSMAQVANTMHSIAKAVKKRVREEHVSKVKHHNAAS